MERNEWTKLERLVAAIEQSGIDIAPEYDSYMKLAFALSAVFGEAGRPYFHRICRLSAKYDAADAEKLYNGALKRNHGLCSLGTLYHLVGEAGVPLDASMKKDFGTQDSGAKDEKWKMGVPKDLTHARVYNKVNHALTQSPEDKGQRKEGPHPDGKPDETTGKPDENTGETGETTGEPEELSPTEGEVMFEGCAPSSPLPTFPSYSWPRLVQHILDIAGGDTPCQRDILLLTALSTLGGCMGRLVRIGYKGTYFYPCMQLSVTAPPASGKGVMQLVRLLAENVHKEIFRQTLEAEKAYEKEIYRISTLGKARAEVEIPEKPKKKMLLIPGNNSGTGILQLLMDSGGVGIIFEAEADTIVTAIQSEYGKWSDLLRNAFDHQRLAYNRRGNGGEYREIEESLLTVVLSGTPEQIKQLIPSAENGLFSRNLFYFLISQPHWEDQFGPCMEDLRSQFNRMGQEWKEELKRLKQLGQFTLQLTLEQKNRFNAFYSQLNERAQVVNGYDMVSYVRRLAVNQLRMMEVVALQRMEDELPQGDLSRLKKLPHCEPAGTVNDENRKDGVIPSWNLTMTDDDFNAVLSMAEPLYEHAAHVLSFLPHEDMKRRSNSEKDRLFAHLPHPFTRKDVKERALELHINPNTALYWLQELSKGGHPIAKKGRGLYEICLEETVHFDPKND